MGSHAKRRARTDGPDALHHVTGRVNWQSWHLMQPGAIGLLSTVLEAELRRFEIDLLAFVFMSNHYHLVVRSPPVDLFRILTSRRTPCRHLRPWPPSHYKSSVLSHCMKNVLQVVSRKLQADLGVTGRFWEDPYDARTILDTSSLVIRVAYDHRNPVKAGIVMRCEEYGPSSAAFWKSGAKPCLPLLQRGGLPFGLQFDAFRSDVVRYQESHLVDDVVAAFKKRRVRWDSAVGAATLRQLAEEAGLSISC